MVSSLAIAALAIAIGITGFIAALQYPNYFNTKPKTLRTAPLYQTRPIVHDVDFGKTGIKTDEELRSNEKAVWHVDVDGIIEKWPIYKEWLHYDNIISAGVTRPMIYIKRTDANGKRGNGESIRLADELRESQGKLAERDANIDRILQRDHQRAKELLEAGKPKFQRPAGSQK